MAMTANEVTARVPTDPGGDQASFTSFVTAVTAAFGDPTRREIYLRLHAEPNLTVTELADAFGLHPNAARHHLDRLVAGGYVVGEVRHRPGEVGRPARRYRCADGELALEAVARREDLMVLLLQRALELLGPEQAEQMALEVGETYGRALAETMGAEQGQRSVRAAMESVASAMTAHGFAARAEGDADAAAVVASQCPFGDAAQHQPVLCAAERGMVTGLLGGLCGDELSQKVAFSSRARGDASCRSSL